MKTPVHSPVMALAAALLLAGCGGDSAAKAHVKIQNDKILELWPEYGFKPYAERTQNTQCLE